MVLARLPPGPRGPTVALIVGWLFAGSVFAGSVFAGSVLPAAAQEALVLHIRPRTDSIGAAGSPGAMLAAREAVWARSNARARVIIESVCTGCLAPWRPALSETRQAESEPSPVTVVAGGENPGARGLEPDLSSGASGPTSDSPSHERQP